MAKKQKPASEREFTLTEGELREACGDSLFNQLYPALVAIKADRLAKRKATQARQREEFKAIKAFYKAHHPEDQA